MTYSNHTQSQTQTRVDASLCGKLDETQHKVCVELVGLVHTRHTHTPDRRGERDTATQVNDHLTKEPFLLRSLGDERQEETTGNAQQNQSIPLKRRGYLQIRRTAHSVCKYMNDKQTTNRPNKHHLPGTALHPKHAN